MAEEEGWVTILVHVLIDGRAQTLGAGVLTAALVAFIVGVPELHGILEWRSFMVRENGSTYNIRVDFDRAGSRSGVGRHREYSRWGFDGRGWGEGG